MNRIIIEDSIDTEINRIEFENVVQETDNKKGVEVVTTKTLIIEDKTKEIDHDKDNFKGEDK